MRASTSGTTSRPIGTLSQKIHVQSMPSTTAPPTGGRPAATASPVMALKMPIAAPRFSGGKAALRSARPSGITNAAPMPCSARPGDQPADVGHEHAGCDASVKSATPAA